MKDKPEPDKSISVEVLLKMYETRWILAKQAEDQRATMSNFLITIAAVMFAFISQQGFTRKTIVISVLTICLGLFGLFMSGKYAQHYLKNFGGAMLIRNRIAQLCPEAQLLEIDIEAGKKNRSNNPLFSKVPTLYLWIALHSAICLLGIVCIVIALLQ